MASDAFTYSNGDLATVSSGVWAGLTTDGASALTVTSNQIVLATPSIDHIVLYNTDLGNAYHDSELDVNLGAAGGSNFAGLGVVTRGGHYLAMLTSTSADSLQCYMWSSGGTFTQPGDIAGNVSGLTTTNHIRMVSNGSVHQVYVGGVLVKTFNNATYTTEQKAGVFGFCAAGAASMATGDNWSGVSLAAAAYAADPPLLVGSSAAIVRSNYW